MSDAAKKQESKIRYEAATQPKPTYKTPKGEEKPIKPDSPHVQTVRKYVTHERYVTYDNRASTFYGPYYSAPQPYNDFFSPFLMGYLLSSAINSHDRATWVYHHRDQMDEARYKELLAKDAELKARLDALEKEKKARDPNYVLPTMKDNPDLQYSKDFVNASYNPQEVAEEDSDEGSGAGTVFMWIFIVLIVLILLTLFVYYFFIKDYKYGT